MKKFYNLFNVKQIQIVTAFCVMAILFCCIQFTAPAITYSPDSTVVTSNEGDSTSSGKNWADAGVSIANDMQKDLVKFAMALIPVLFIIAFLVLAFCKDPRTASQIIRWIVVIAVVAIVILIINSGAMMEIITDFASKITA